MKLNKIKLGMAVCLCSGMILSSFFSDAADFSYNGSWKRSTFTATTAKDNTINYGYYLVASSFVYDKNGNLLGTSGIKTKQLSNPTCNESVVASCTNKKANYALANFYISTLSTGGDSIPGGVFYEKYNK